MGWGKWPQVLLICYRQVVSRSAGSFAGALPGADILAAQIMGREALRGFVLTAKKENPPSELGGLTLLLGEG